MAFASIHVPNFPVQAVVRAEPGLGNRAVALVDGTPPIWNVVAANEVALLAGIELGMSKSQATPFRAVEIRKRSRVQEKSAHAALLDLGASFSPRLEDTASDTIILDISGLTSLFGSDENISAQLVQRASALGLFVHVAVSSNLEVSLHAARGFSGITVIPPGEEAKSLGQLSVRTLLPSAEILETLERWGVRDCAALAALPVLQLSERLGQEGVRLHELARGACLRSLVLAQPGVCFEEEMALDFAIAELEPLAFLLGRLLDQLCARLEARALTACAIRTHFDLEDSFEKDFQLLSESSPPKLAPKTYEKVLRLPVPTRNSKMLLKLLRLQLQEDPPHAAVLKIILSAEPARPRAAQGGLFLPSSPDPEKLELTIGRLAKLVGPTNVGSPELIDTHGPGDFRMARFAPVSDESTIPSKNRSAVAHGSRETPRAAFRVFRPEIQANVELQQNYPTRIYFRGMRGNIIAASGPWRTSGNWWREDPWQQDEWDVEVRFDSVSGQSQKISSPRTQNGIYRIYYDSLRAAWFARGRYD
ncbi:MAG TPA: DNA polymerase Y family protein [Candidatus Binatus sp.]|nr:DNA polymerase Y family protein [Candidatus Binatus sp.]